MGLADVRPEDMDGDVKDFTGFETFSVIFISIGAFVIIVGGLGMFGACCSNKCMLVTVSTCSSR